MFPCKQCGAKLEYMPGSDAQKCPYCSAENVIPKSDEDIHELDYVAFLRNAAASEEVVERITVKCTACGAESTQAPNVTADRCPFFGADIVATASSSKQIKPKALLPFAITREVARDSFRKWIHGLWFAPNALKRLARQESPIDGMYTPHWTYDCNTTSHYTGLRGDYYWTTETYTTTENGRTVTRTRQVRKVRWTPVSGVVRNSFDDVLVVASQSLPKKHAEALEPWDLSNLSPYQDEYLSGFRAESYQVSLDQGFERAKEIMAGTIHATICRDIGGDLQQVSSVSTQYDNVTFKHILLPVWISAYRYGHKVYRFLVNARTGEVQGERPWSWVKITLAIFASLPFIAGIAYYIAENQS
jgi:DNA-directed RNA polymerase subunit RPC12/RpoP